jgi:aminopeptidase
MNQVLNGKLRKYAETAVRVGCNLQPGQELFVSADVCQAPLVRHIVQRAYESGASDVTVSFGDEQVGRMHYEYRSAESFKEFPAWRALLQNGLAQRGAAMLFISSEDPEAMTGIDQVKLMNRIIASNEACKDWRDGMDFGRNVWCIIGASSPAWAHRVFPDLSEDEAVAKLWDAILHTARCDGEDPATAWAAHKASFDKRRAWLNEQHFDSLHYSNAHGTDIVIGLPAGHIWNGGGDTTVGGIDFFPNMPTEEVFTTPDRRRADGTVAASMSLNHAGSLIEGFQLTFEKGRVVDYSAEQGQDVLKQIVETDEGSHHLGECALIPKTSPIAQTGILFLNTLFDENASCHFALGMGFPDCYAGGRDMDKARLLDAGVNDSATHVDFMLGTDDLSITGIRADGAELEIFHEGDWAF